MKAQTCFPTASKIDSRYNRKLSLLCLFALPTGSRRASIKCSGLPAIALSPMGFNEVNVHRLLLGCHKINFVFVRIWTLPLLLPTHLPLLWPITHCSLKDGKLYLQEKYSSGEAYIFLSTVIFSRINESILFLYSILMAYTYIYITVFLCRLFTLENTFLFFLALRTNRSAFDYVFCEWFNHSHYFGCPQ